MRWEVTGIPNGESGNYKVQQCTETTGEPSWLNYVNYRNISPGNYTVLYRKFGNSWLNIMQDTEQEYGEHDWLTSRMSGHILIAGLGIGMIHIPLLASSDVTSVTVVEKEQDVIDLVWPYCEKDDRYTLVHDDIETWVPPEGSYWDYAWFDAWVFNNEMSYEDHMALMQERYSDYIGSSGQWLSKQPE